VRGWDFIAIFYRRDSPRLDFNLQKAVSLGSSFATEQAHVFSLQNGVVMSGIYPTSYFSLFLLL